MQFGKSLIYNKKIEVLELLLVEHCTSNFLGLTYIPCVPDTIGVWFWFGLEFGSVGFCRGTKDRKKNLEAETRTNNKLEPGPHRGP